MNKKKNQLKSRSEDLKDCETTILQMFADKHITVSEALFIFEKIKFAAFYGEMTVAASQFEIKRQKDSQLQAQKQSMFR